MALASDGRRSITATAIGISIRSSAGRLSATNRGVGCRITSADGSSNPVLAGFGRRLVLAFGTGASPGAPSPLFGSVPAARWELFPPIRWTRAARHPLTLARACCQLAPVVLPRAQPATAAQTGRFSNDPPGKRRCSVSAAGRPLVTCPGGKAPGGFCDPQKGSLHRDRPARASLRKQKCSAEKNQEGEPRSRGAR